MNAHRIAAVCLSLFVGVSLAPALACSFVLPAHALSELQQLPGADKAEDEAPSEDDASDEPDIDEPVQLPMPDPLVNKGAATQEDPATAGEPETAKPVEVLTDLSRVPEPVRRMRDMILEAASSGDMERLRPLLGKGMTQTQVSQLETGEDPVTTLKGLSGDADGIEVLAILIDVLNTGFVLSAAGTPDETYVWPYFTEKSLSQLTPPEKVDLLRLVTAGDFADMVEFGGYNFYKTGITPDGQWKFFIAGD